MTFQINKIFILCAILGFFSLSTIPVLTFAQEIGNITNPLNASNLEHSNGNLVDLVQNSIFTSVNLTTALPADWNDIFSSCATDFRCEINTTNGWFDNQSFQISTQNNTNGTWSWISSQGIDVRPSENYEIFSHMKLNEWVTQSHVLLDGYNETSQQWYEIEQCPHGSNGPMDWMEFHCRITIPPATSTIVVILNAGWSSQMNKDAITLFDGIHVFKLSDTNSEDNQTISNTNTNNSESSALDNASSSTNEDNNIQASKDNTNSPENYDNLEELVKDIKNGVVNSEEISLSAFQDSGAYQGADQETQDCIDLAGKIGDNLGDQEIVNCSEDPNFYKNEISNKQ